MKAFRHILSTSFLVLAVGLFQQTAFASGTSGLFDSLGFAEEVGSAAGLAVADVVEERRRRQRPIVRSLGGPELPAFVPAVRIG